MEVAFKYGRLMAKPTRKSVDAEATLFGPFILMASLLTYFASFFSFFAVSPFVFLWQFMLQFAAVLTTLSITVCGLALIYVSKPRRLRNLLWLPFIYFYWFLQAFVAFFALLLILLRRPRRWIKTEKTGLVTSLDVLG